MTSTAVRRALVAAPAREMQLTNWPLRDTAPLAWLVIGTAVGLSVAISAITSTAGGFAAFFALALAMWRLWVPVRFDLGPDGVTQTVFGRRRRVSWRKIAQFSITRRGVILYPFPEELRPFAPRSVYIRGGRQVERLVEMVSYYVGTSVGRRSPSSLIRSGELSTGSVSRSGSAPHLEAQHPEAQRPEAPRRDEAQSAGADQATQDESSARLEAEDRDTREESTTLGSPPPPSTTS